jgi:hypothetical protein
MYSVKIQQILNLHAQVHQKKNNLPPNVRFFMQHVEYFATFAGAVRHRGGDAAGATAILITG